MAKKKQIKKKKKEYISFLRELTNWVCNKDRDDSRMTKLIEDYGTKTNDLFLRIGSYCYNSLHLVWYFNKYFNNFYEMSSADPLIIVKSMAYVMDVNNHSSRNSFFYLKSADHRDYNKLTVKKVIREYFEKVLDKYINDIELNFYYSLFIKQHITIDELNEMNSAVNGKESKLNIREVDMCNISGNDNDCNAKEEIKNVIDHYRTRTLPQPFVDYINQLKQALPNRPECQGCKLKGKPSVFFDSNLEDFGEVDIAFIALNPERDDVTYGKPLVGKSGSFHRSHMLKMPEQTKWVLLNIMVCSTNSQKEIGKNEREILNVANNCKGILIDLLKKFPTKYYVPMGAPAAKTFGIKGSITQQSGNLQVIDNKNIIPCVHPSAVIQYHGNMEIAYNEAFQTIYRVMNEKFGITNEPQVQNNSDVLNTLENIKQFNKSSYGKYNIPSEKIVQEITTDLTLFDIVNLDGANILMTFIDKEGKKWYKIEPYELPVYIKNVDWKNAEMLTNHVDSIIHINGYNRLKLMTAVRDSMAMTKKKPFQTGGN